MFVWLNKQGVKSDAGYIVQFTSRFSAEYHESGKTIDIYVEDGMQAGQPCIILSNESFAKWSDGTTILPDERSRLVDNFRQALDFQGLKLIINK